MSGRLAHMTYLLPALLLFSAVWSAGQGDWPVWRHDTALTGRSGLRGDMIAAPSVAWRYPPTDMQGLLAIDPSAAGARAADQAGQATEGDYLAEMGNAWGMRPFTYTLPDGEPLVLSENAARRIGHFHPDLPEPQQVLMTGTGDGARISLSVWDQADGSRREVWSSPPGSAAYERWNICLGDIDGDGVEEIIVAGHGGVMAYDPRDGALKCQYRYGHRSRGFIGVADIDGDGAVEFLDIGLFQIAVEVCDYRDGELGLLWGDRIELDIFAHPRIVNTPFDALCDLNGDGRHEVVYNMLNDHGDEQWHVVIRDALTGDVRWDIPKVFLNDSLDIDGDGVRELMGIETEGRFCQGFAPAFVAHLGTDGLDKLWTHEGARWPLRPVLDMPRHRSTWRSSGGAVQICWGDLDGDGRLEVVFSERPGGVGMPERFTIVGPDGDGVYRSGWSVAAPASTSTTVRAIADVDDDGTDEMLVQWRSNGRDGAQATGDGATPRIVSWQPLMPRLGPPIAADLHGDGRLTVLATSAVDEVVAISPPSEPGAAPRELWRHPGRGTEGTNCLGAADLDGDGDCEVPVVGESPSGQARVTALDGDGGELWHRDFDEIHGQRAIFRMGSVTHLFVGHLTDAARSDVYVSMMRSIMHSDVGLALRGTDGELLWRQEKARNMGYGGSGLAFADTDGDGLDEIYCGYPICYWKADGRTGELEFFVDPGDVLPGWPGYAVPIIADLTGDGALDAFFPSHYVWGLLTIDGENIWNLPAGDLPPGFPMPGIGDVDGDGAVEVGAPFGDGFRCYAGATGRLEWTVAVPSGPYAGVISADVDGDGRDEFVFAAGERVVAVGAADAAGDGAGALVWEAVLPGRVSQPAIADVDADGLAEILVTCADGYLYCLDR